ncbi:MAG TPA: hypothetical protein DEF47_08260 [Herpetosiphon sp.]|uniref:Uncharacterized protein n=1 Tax=Herpetosiphon aurantiacus (strain ATCC 23779 / DSM 785 / 114-95) TaxID=316274 RepID=A9AUI8_HERA2|nr:hypothetical protein [Herpetosiphon sp.]ABX04515.1 hypothetical protein Haur_1872 [Herpetosiphon aurantiacus DSM 785]HBW49886.1 hypothetical protein [Herpetosiphon sp.]
MSQLKAGSRATMPMMVVGGFLVLVGLLVFYAPFEVSPVVQALIPLVMGIVMLVMAVISSTVFLFTGGSLLTGIGLGFLLNATAFSDASSPSRFGILCVTFGIGWLFSAVGSKLVLKKSDWLSFIPGVVFAGFGGALLANLVSSDQMTNLNRFFGLFRFWPLILIIAGFTFMFKRSKS